MYSYNKNIFQVQISVLSENTCLKDCNINMLHSASDLHVSKSFKKMECYGSLYGFNYQPKSIRKITFTPCKIRRKFHNSMHLSGNCLICKNSLIK